MTKREGEALFIDVKGLLQRDEDFLRSAVEGLVHAALEAEMTEAVGAERASARSGGLRLLRARAGDACGSFANLRTGAAGAAGSGRPLLSPPKRSTELFERYPRAEKALVAALAEMDVQGVSTRKVKAVTGELCGHAFPASSISALNKKRDEPEGLFRAPLEEAFP